MGNRASYSFISSSSSSASSSSAYTSCNIGDDDVIPSKFLNDEVMNQSLSSFNRKNQLRSSPNVNINHPNRIAYQQDAYSLDMSTTSEKYRITNSSSTSPPTSILKSSLTSLPSSPSSSTTNFQSTNSNSTQSPKGHARSRELLYKVPSETKKTTPKRSMSITSEDGCAYMLPLSSPNRSMNAAKSPKNRVHPINAFQTGMDAQYSSSSLKHAQDTRRGSIFEEPPHVDLIRNRSNSLPARSWLEKSHDPRNTIILHSPQKSPHSIINSEPCMVMDTPIVCLTLPDEPPVHHHLHVKRPKKDLKKKRKITRKN